MTQQDNNAPGTIWPQIRRFGSQSAVYAFGSIAARMAGFVLIPLYTEFLKSSEYGVIALLVLVTQTVSTVASFGLMNSMFRLWSNADAAARRRIFSTIVWTQIAIAVAFWVCISASPGGLAQVLLGKTEWGIYVLLATATGLLDMIATTPLGVLRLDEKPRWFVFGTLVRAAVSMGTAVWFIAYAGMGIEGVLWANLVGVGALLVVLLPVFFRYTRLVIDRALLRELVPFGVWYMVGTVAGIFWNMGDRYVLKYLLGLSAVGIYGLGHQLATTVHMLGQSFLSAFLPMGLKHPVTTDGGRFVAKTLTYFAFAVIWVALGFSLLSREIIGLLAQNPDYYAAWEVVPLLVFSFVLYTLVGGVEIGFYFAGMARQNTWVIIGTFALNIALNFFFIPLFGIIGSALAAVTASAARLVFSYIWAQRLYPLPYELRRVGTMLLVACALHVTLAVSGPLWVTASLKFAAASGFPLLLWMLGLLTPAEREKIGSVVASIRRT
jgi:O-antigen/teichoic acid export membrane protein